MEFKYFNEEWNEDKKASEVAGSSINISRMAGGVKDADTNEK